MSVARPAAAATVFRRRLPVWLVSGMLVLAGCSDDGDGAADGTAGATGATAGEAAGAVAGGPAIVAAIAPALDALDALAGGAELFQIAGTPTGVELVVKQGDSAVGYTYVDGELSDGEPLGAASGFTFAAADVAFDPALVLDPIVDELDDPVVTRFEVIGSDQGVLYSAQVLSDAGGALVVDLAPDGTVRGVTPVS